MKENGLKKIIEELKNASEMHLRQSEELQDHAEEMAGAPTKMVSPLKKGRCYWGWQPNPDGRPAADSGSCVEYPAEKGKRPADKPRK